MESAVVKTGGGAVVDDWRKRQSSDHLYYMSTKGTADGGVHTYFNPHRTPYGACASFMNILYDLGERARGAL